MNPQTLIDLARAEHRDRLEEVQRELRRRRAARRRARGHAWWRPPSHRAEPLVPAW